MCGYACMLDAGITEDREKDSKCPLYYSVNVHTYVYQEDLLWKHDIIIQKQLIAK